MNWTPGADRMAKQIAALQGYDSKNVTRFRTQCETVAHRDGYTMVTVVTVAKVRDSFRKVVMYSIETVLKDR